MQRDADDRYTPAQVFDQRLGPTAEPIAQQRLPQAAGRVALGRCDEQLRALVATTQGVVASDFREVSTPEGPVVFDVVPWAASNRNVFNTVVTSMF